MRARNARNARNARPIGGCLRHRTKCRTRGGSPPHCVPDRTKVQKRDRLLRTRPKFRTQQLRALRLRHGSQTRKPSAWLYRPVLERLGAKAPTTACIYVHRMVHCNLGFRSTSQHNSLLGSYVTKGALGHNWQGLTGICECPKTWVQVAGEAHATGGRRDARRRGRQANVAKETERASRAPLIIQCVVAWNSHTATAAVPYAFFNITS